MKKKHKRKALIRARPPKAAKKRRDSDSGLLDVLGISFGALAGVFVSAYLRAWQSGRGGDVWPGAPAEPSASFLKIDDGKTLDLKRSPDGQFSK